MKPQEQSVIDQANEAIANAKGGFQSGKEKKDADAFLNIQIIDNNGHAHNFRGINPIHADGSKLERSLYNKAMANGGLVEVTVTATVRVVEKDDGTDLEL